MTDNFEYISHSRLEYHHGYRHAYLGEVPQPVVYGVQGGLRAYYVVDVRGRCPCGCNIGATICGRNGSNPWVDIGFRFRVPKFIHCGPRPVRSLRTSRLEILGRSYGEVRHPVNSGYAHPTLFNDQLGRSVFSELVDVVGRSKERRRLG